VRRALLALIEAEPEFADAARGLGPPATEATEPERAWVLKQGPRQYGDLTEQGGKSESYVVPVFIEVRVYQDTQDAAEDRAEDLTTIVCGLVEADRELGGACRDCTFEEIDGPSAYATTDGWLAQAVVNFRVESWL
jgi:hypothetical protein